MNTSAPDLHRLTEAPRASILLWTGAALLFLLEWFEPFLCKSAKRILRAEVRFAARVAQAVIFLRGCGLVPNAPRKRKTSRPANAPCGFQARRTRGSARRRFLRGALRIGRGTLAQRICRIRAALKNPERYARKSARHKARGLVRTRIIACTPPILGAPAQQCARTCATADTS